MTRELWGYVIWLSIFAIGAVFECLAAFTNLAPWPTLSTTVWNMEARSSWFSILFLAGLAVLLVHLVFHWPK